jgi:hypothetical protein
MGNALSNIAGWQFLNEPAYKWGIFTGMMLMFLFAWGVVLRHM